MWLVEHGDAAVVAASIHDPEQFEIVFERYHRTIWAYVARLAGRERADELAGDVFVAAFAHRDRYDPSKGSVSSWLYGIASNKLRTRLRTDGRAARAFERAIAGEPSSIWPIDIALEALVGRERLVDSLHALALLSAADREIIALFAWERLSYDAIAAALEIEIGTVRSRLSRARRRLRELMGPSGEEWVTSACDERGR